MTLHHTEWLITSDLVLEAAFRIDLCEPHQGMWVLSYLPTHLRLTRAQALTGMTLAETVLGGQIGLGGQIDGFDPLAQEVAQLRANELGCTLFEVAGMLATRASSAVGGRDPLCATVPPVVQGQYRGGIS